MTSTQDYGESVLFAFVREARVLCEVREWDGATMDSVPGGKVDPADCAASDYLVAALLRETAEELHVRPTAYRRVGQVWYGREWLFHVFVVCEWQGSIPEAVLDTRKRLHWVDLDRLVDNTHMLGLADLIRSALAEP